MKKTNILDLLFPIIIALVGLFGSWISKEYRVILIILFLFVIVIYFLSNIYQRLEENEEKEKEQDLEIKRINEKVKIYEELIDIKSDLKLLKGR